MGHKTTEEREGPCGLSEGPQPALLFSDQPTPLPQPPAVAPHGGTEAQHSDPL